MGWHAREETYHRIRYHYITGSGKRTVDISIASLLGGWLIDRSARLGQVGWLGSHYKCARLYNYSDIYVYEVDSPGRVGSDQAI